MPLGLLRACSEMLPRLKAEEALAVAEAVALGTGSLKPADARARSAQLTRQAVGEHSGRQKASPMLLATLGVGVVAVKKGGARDL